MGADMDDNVLRFGPRDREDRQWSTSELDGSGPGTAGSGWSDDRRYDAPEPGLGELVKVVLLGQHLLAVERDPIEGSEYEHEVRELEGLGLRWRPEPPLPPVQPPRPAPHEQQLAWLALIVGGEKALADLDSAPLPPAPLDLDAVPAHLRDRVASIAARFEPWVPLALGDEGLTAARRLLTRAVSTEPGLLRSDRDDIAAGAVVWAVAKGNDLIGQNRPAANQRHPGVGGPAAPRRASGVPPSRTRWAAWPPATAARTGSYGGQRPDVIPLGQTPICSSGGSGAGSSPAETSRSS